jgi:glycosidase
MERKWWMEAVGYQIYPKSFFDSNGDGIGDLKGITMKLDYLSMLGVNLLWICPFYTSPMDDNGYDVSDFYDVAEEFGSLDDVRELIREAHARGIKIIADLVLNHTSDEHPWFIESRQSTNNPYRDFYIWAKPRHNSLGEEIEPTNWASFFGGSCWQKDATTDEYYMKIFSKKMPDLNWKNAGLRREIYKMTEWWIDLGIDGFRIDAVSHLAKSDFSDSTMSTYETYKPDWGKYSNLEQVHEYLREMNREVFFKHDVVTIGEVGGGALVESGILYSGFDRNELDMVFNFDHNWCNNVWNGATSIDDIWINLPCLKENFKKWQHGLYGNAWSPLYWLNHDHPRVVSHYGSMRYQIKSAKMLGTALHMMWGTPFVYNGEEIGMTNVDFRSIGDFHDISVHTQYNINVVKNGQDEMEFIRDFALRSRDNARGPMQWDDSAHAGFTMGKPWFQVNDNHKTINVASQVNNPDSIFHHYRKLIALRRNSVYKDVVVYGDYQPVLEKDEYVYSYTRTHLGQKILVICNFFEYNVMVAFEGWKADKIVLSNYDDSSMNLCDLRLRPYEAVVYEVSASK